MKGNIGLTFKYLHPTENQPPRPNTEDPGPPEFNEAEQPQETFNVEPFDFDSFMSYERRMFENLPGEEAASFYYGPFVPEEVEQIRSSLEFIGHDHLRTMHGPTGLDAGHLIEIRTRAMESIHEQMKYFVNRVEKGFRIYLLSIVKYRDFTGAIDPKTFLPLNPFNPEDVTIRMKIRYAERQIA